MDSENLKEDKLRIKAEKISKDRFYPIDNLSKDELIQELRVHQIELELQNEELLESQLKLSDSQNKYFDLYNFAPIGYFTLDKNGLILEVNLAGATLLGVERRNLINHAFIRYVDIDYRNKFHHHSNKFLETETKHTIELKLLKKDNNSFYAHLETVNILEEKGDLKESRITVTDITHLKNTENDLMEAKEEYLNLFNSIDEGFCTIEVIFDENNKAVDYRYLKINHAFEKQTGLIEAQGKMVKDIVPNLEEYWFEIYGKIALTGEPIRFIDEVKELDKWYDVFAFKIGDTQSREVAVIFNDITKRKKVEMELEDYHNILEDKVKKRTEKLNKSLKDLSNTETLLSSITNLSSDVIYVKDRQSRWIFVNPALERIVGKSSDDLLGKNDLEIYSNKEIGKTILDHDSRIMNSGKEEILEEIVETKDGIRSFLSVKTPRYNEKGQVIGIVGISHDITQRNENLKKLKQSNKELKQFAYITSHDLREPLRMITSFLQLLERRYKDKLDEDANEFIEFAVDGAKRLDRMTNDLLQYSKITNEKRDITLINFEHVLEHTLQNLKVQIEENNAVITHDPLPQINGDEQLNVHLFQNIIGNAIKYRSQETPKIHITAKKEKNQYIFSIRDNGIGISPKHLERIFTIFQRLHSHEEYEGTGIGLAIAQKIIHQQGGQIWAESVLGKGTTFYFTIPENNNS